MDLAASNRITTFSISGDGPRYVAPASAFALLKCHNNLESRGLDFHDSERKIPNLRVQLRTQFARCLRDMRCSTLTDLCLSYRYEEPNDQRFANADVRDSHGGSTQDTLSASLHGLLVACRKLKRINLDGPICIDEHLFWIDDLKTAEPLWPDLEDVHLRMRPDGGWYLDSYPGVPLDEPIRANDIRLQSSDPDSDDSVSCL